MRIFCLTLFTIAFLGTSLPGQEGVLRLGFQMSPRFSWLTTNSPTINKNGTNLGIVLGTIGEYHFSEYHAVTMGFNLAFNQGGTLKYDVGGNLLPESELSEESYNSGAKPLADGAEIKYKLQYLEIPIGLKLRTREFGTTRLFIEAPVLTWGIRTQARGEIEADGVSTAKENIKWDVSAFNFSWGLTAGGEFFFSERNSVVAGIGYRRGFMDLTTDKATLARNNPEQDPNNPNDDYIIRDEDSKGVLNGITIKLGVIF